MLIMCEIINRIMKIYHGALEQLNHYVGRIGLVEVQGEKPGGLEFA